jgi:hypothetical protein
LRSIGGEVKEATARIKINPLPEITDGWH